MNKPMACVEFERAVPARFTTAEFIAMCDAGAFSTMKVELVDGEILRMSPPMLPHSCYQSRLIFLLSTVVNSGSQLTTMSAELPFGVDVAVPGTADTIVIN
jgi:Uma2 family endonuclease